MSPDAVTPALRRPAEDLALLQGETQRLLATVAGLDDAAVAGDSRCAGWTRGHVVTHLARNADALRRLVRRVLTGDQLPMYASDEARDQEIEQGADRPARDQEADLRLACERFAAYAAPLGTEDWLADEVVPARGGRTVAVRDLPWLRLREVVVHHLDLDAGFAYGDLPDRLQHDLLVDQAPRLGGAGVAVRLLTDEGDDLVTAAGGGPTVTLRGSRAALLGWATRGLTDGVATDGDLPTLPFGG